MPQREKGRPGRGPVERYASDDDILETVRVGEARGLHTSGGLAGTDGSPPWHARGSHAVYEAFR